MDTEGPPVKKHKGYTNKRTVEGCVAIGVVPQIIWLGKGVKGEGPTQIHQ